MGTYTFVLLMGCIGALIGWFTNLLAIKLLFWPYKEYSFSGLKIQGVIPKRQQDIAAALGHIVSSELITSDDVVSSLGNEEIKLEISQRISQHAQERILEKMPVFIPRSIQYIVLEFIRGSLQQEIVNLLNNGAQFLKEDRIKDEIQKIVEQRVLSFDVKQMEELTYELAKQELKHIELTGGFLGFIIGVVQGIIVGLFHFN